MSWNDHLNHGDKLAGKLETIAGNHLAVNLGDYYSIYGVNVSKMAVWFRDLPRYGSNFQPLSNISLLGATEEEYGHMLIMYGAMAGIVAVALSLALVTFCCCNCMFRSAASRRPKYKGTKGAGGRGGSWFCGLIVLAIAILGAATFIVGIVGEIRLHTGAEDVCQTVNTVDRTAHRILNDTANIQKELQVDQTLGKIEAPMNSIEDSIKQLENADLIAQVASIKAQYTEIKGQIEGAQEKIASQIGPDSNVQELLQKALDVLAPVKEQCPEVTKFLRLGNLLVLIVLALSSLLFIVGLCGNCFRTMVAILGYLAFNLLIVFGIAAFVFLVVGSDFCTESKPLVEKYIKSPMVEYYLYCNESSANTSAQHHLTKRDLVELSLPKLPGNLNFSSSIDLNALFGQVKEFIAAANASTVEYADIFTTIEANAAQLCSQFMEEHGIVGRSPAELCKQLTDNLETIKTVVIGGGASDEGSLLGQMDSVAGSVLSILNTVDCRSLSVEIDASLSNMCTNIYEAFFFFLVNSLAAVVCFYVLLLFTIWMLF